MQESRTHERLSGNHVNSMAIPPINNMKAGLSARLFEKYIPTALFCNLKQSIQNFCRCVRATTTVELVFWIPIYLFIFMIIFDYGNMTFKYAMLERAVRIEARNIAVNSVETGIATDKIRQNICDNFYVSSTDKCADQIKVDILAIINLSEIHTQIAEFDCLDETGAIRPSLDRYNLPASDAREPRFLNFGGTGVSTRLSELVILRVCTKAGAVFPTSRLSLGIRETAEGSAILGTSTIFSIDEP